MSLALSVAFAASCSALLQLHVANTSVTSASLVEAGALRLPQERAEPEFFTAFDRLPSFCRLQATVTPSRDSHIEVEVWLPANHWNCKYLGTGNGGYGGSFNYFRLGEALNAGYATASTDTGHKGKADDAQWAVGPPETQIDFDERSIHWMTVVAKAAIRAFYGRAPDHSYFNSCSNGGRQGLMEAERYPADYDGIMAGAPAIDYGFKTFLSNRLDAFRRRGGKLVIYHGSEDRPELTIRYFRQIKEPGGFAQLYVVPGMRHCGGGPVPNDFGQWLRAGADEHHSMLIALERWVEDGVPPRELIATQYKSDGDPASGVLRTRPICRYPDVAKWSGRGDQNDAIHYSCVHP